jgi:AraC-like DNA-binding protein
MRYLLEKKIESGSRSFTVQLLEEPHFDQHWHFHPHYQIFTVLQSEGTRFIGDSIQRFRDGDTVFLAPNVPHLWLNDKPYFEPNHGKYAKGIVLYFTDDFFGKDFFAKPDAAAIMGVLEKSQRGLLFGKKTSHLLRNKLQKLQKLSGFGAIIGLLELLYVLSESADYEYIVSPNYVNTNRKSETLRMQKVHDFVSENFKTDIKLSAIAAHVNMAEAAFCRYFKKRANKTFSQFVSNVRVGHACKLLEASQLNIAEVGFECGFNTLSHFNKQFKEIVGSTPSQYKRLLK